MIYEDTGSLTHKSSDFIPFRSESPKFTHEYHLEKNVLNPKMNWEKTD